MAINSTFGEDTSVAVHCTEHGGHADFPTMLNRMEHSEFCLVLPGDSQSTRRLSEIFLAGQLFHTGHACMSGWQLVASLPARTRLSIYMTEQQDLALRWQSINGLHSWHGQCRLQP